MTNFGYGLSMSPKMGTTKHLTHPSGVGYLIHTARERPQKERNNMAIHIPINITATPPRFNAWDRLKLRLRTWRQGK